MHSSLLHAKPGPNAFKKPVPRIARPIDVMKIPAEFLPEMMNRGNRMQLWKDKVANAVVPVWFKHHDKPPKERAYLYVKDKIQWAAWGEPIDDEEEMQKYLKAQEDEALSRRPKTPDMETGAFETVVDLEVDEEESDAADEVEAIWLPPPSNSITWTTVMGLPCVSLGDMCQARLKNKQSDDIVYYSNLRVRDRGLAFRLMSPEFSLVKKIEVERMSLPMGDYWREWRWLQIERQQQAFEAWFRGYYRTHKPAVFQTSESCFTPSTLGKKRKREPGTENQPGSIKNYMSIEDDGSPVRLLEPELSKLSPTWPRGVLRKARSTHTRQWHERFAEERICPNCDTLRPKLVQRLTDERLEYCCSLCSMALGWSSLAESDESEKSASDIEPTDTCRDEPIADLEAEHPPETDTPRAPTFSDVFDSHDDHAYNMLATPDGTPEPSTHDTKDGRTSLPEESVPPQNPHNSLAEDEIVSLRGQVEELACTIHELKAANKRLIQDYRDYIEGEANLLRKISRPFLQKPNAPRLPSIEGVTVPGHDECGQQVESPKKPSWWMSWFSRGKT